MRLLGSVLIHPGVRANHTVSHMHAGLVVLGWMCGAKPGYGIPFHFFLYHDKVITMHEPGLIFTDPP
jgi:hypothetical protein